MILVHRLEMDPHTIITKLAHSLRVSLQTVISHSHNSFGMKRYHLRCVLRIWTIIASVDDFASNVRRWFKQLVNGLWELTGLGENIVAELSHIV
jgi:hypothetical protein